MARDGTNRGGARIGAGRKPKALSEKMLEGKLEVNNNLPSPSDMDGDDVPSVRDYMTATQKNGMKFYAKDIFNETWRWLKANRCEKLVTVSLIEEYALCAARCIQCESAITEYGFLAKHPTTGAAIATPYHTMAINYHKQSMLLFSQLQQLVNNHGTGGFAGASPKDMLMERILSAREGK